MSEDLKDFWTDDTSVLLTSFWGWTPDSWGTLSFGSKGRRDNLLNELTDPFIAIIYVTSNKSEIDPVLKGKVAGFYVVSHKKGHRHDFSDPIHHNRSPEKWQHALQAVRAFSFIPEARITIDQFDPTLVPDGRAMSVGTFGEIVTDLSKIHRLKKVPFVEVDCYGSTNGFGRFSYLHEAKKGMVSGGPKNRGGYFVSPEANEMPHELYLLRLAGSTEAFLGEPAEGRSIYKIGLSISPELRRQHFQKTLPKGAFSWKTSRSTKLDGHDAYGTFDAAKSGEDAMKMVLSQNATWLNGEFYAATEQQIETAWRSGHLAARKYKPKASDK